MAKKQPTTAESLQGAFGPVLESALYQPQPKKKPAPPTVQTMFAPIEAEKLREQEQRTTTFSDLLRKIFGG